MEVRWADTRIHGTTKPQVARCSDEERPFLLRCHRALSLLQYGERTVHLDGCVEVEAAYYSDRRAGSVGVSSAVGTQVVRC